MRDSNGNVPDNTWHLSDAHGMVIIYGGGCRWLTPDPPEKGAGCVKNMMTHAELTALVGHLNATGFVLPTGEPS